MTITGLHNAIIVAKDRAQRSKESICIVQVDKDEYILWRYKTRANIPHLYKHFRIVKVIEYKR